MRTADAIEDGDELPAVIADGDQMVDPRLAFLARAAAKHYLVENGLEDLDQAFADLHHALHVIAPCQCQRSMLDAWERLDHAKPIQAARKPRRRDAPASTFDATVYALKTRGSAALGEPRCRQRLRELSADQVRELLAALTRLKPRCPVISEELLVIVGKRA